MTKKSKAPKDFIVFILSHGRANKLITIRTLRRSGYTGPIKIILDDTDKQIEDYRRNFGSENIYVFNKNEIKMKFDVGDNVQGEGVVLHARNACFQIAEELGFTYFMELDDDYTYFQNRFLPDYSYNTKRCAVRSLNGVLSSVLNYYRNAEKITSIAFAQGGDFIGGSNNTHAQLLTPRRKCMNSFICSTERPFPFSGKINEDVVAYTHLASKGYLFFTLNQLLIIQTPTQVNDGGMTTIYMSSGTYRKSFYSVMFMPSSVTVHEMGNKANNKRLHHRVSWNNTCPLILDEKHKKRSLK